MTKRRPLPARRRLFGDDIAHGNERVGEIPVGAAGADDGDDDDNRNDDVDHHVHAVYVYITQQLHAYI